MSFKKNLFLLKSVWHGDTVLRSLMHVRCREVSLKNETVLDLGSGKSLPAYHTYFKDRSEKNITIDMQKGKGDHVVIDFEKDNLPFQDQEFSTVLSFNLFEHIFNYQKLLDETFRVTRKGGRLIGFVPFLINYHPDPHDYFRYTDEALEKIFQNAGFSEITIERIGGGPFLVNFNNLVLSVPRVFRVILLPFYLVLDYIFLKLRPAAKKRYPLGYFFTARK